MRNKYVGEDIRQRLGGTVIRYNNRPYYCAVDGGLIILQDLVTGRIEHKVTADDPLIDISSLDLGYVNISHPLSCAVHCARAGQRRYKQGVDFHHLVYNVLTIPSEKFSMNGDWMKCQGFLDAYEGKYPSFKDATKMISSGSKSVALSREVAILRDKDIMKVFVKNDEVGWYKAGTNSVYVPTTETSWITGYYLETIEGWKIVEGVK